MSLSGKSSGGLESSLENKLITLVVFVRDANKWFKICNKESKRKGLEGLIMATKRTRSVVWVCALGTVIYDSLFGEPGAKAKFFGNDFNAPNVCNWVLFPEVPERATNSLAIVKRLTRSEEEMAFRRYNYAKFMMAKMERWGKRSRPAYKVWKDRAEMMHVYIATSNLSLVVAMAKYARIEGVEFSELISEGNMILLRAVEKFDASRGFKFSTYACGSILTGFSRMASKVARRSSRERLVPAAEFVSYLGVRGPTTDDDRDIAGENALGELKDTLKFNSAGLNDTETKILVHRFGLEGETPKTLKQVRGMMGLSEERIRQIQIAAIAKIRESMDVVMN